LRPPERRTPWGSFLQIRYVANLKSIYRTVSAVLIWCAAIVSAILLHRFGHWFQSTVSLAGLGLAFGGAAGNLLDILRRHCVVDFVDLGWWPVFNFADIGIVGGLILAFLPHI
jgi:lipoprotein signal peptidase